MGIKEDLERAAMGLGEQKRREDHAANEKRLEAERTAEVSEGKVRRRDKYLEDLYEIIYTSGYLTQATGELVSFLNPGESSQQSWNIRDVQGSDITRSRRGDDNSSDSGSVQATNYQGKLLFRVKGNIEESYIQGRDGNRYVDKPFTASKGKRVVNRFLDVEELFIGFVFYSGSKSQDFEHNCNRLTLMHRPTLKVSNLYNIGEFSEYDFRHDNSVKDVIEFSKKSYFTREIVDDVARLAEILDDPIKHDIITHKIDRTLIDFAAKNVKDFPKI